VIESESATVSSRLLRKHYERKHGPKATYGQKGSSNLAEREES